LANIITRLKKVTYECLGITRAKSQPLWKEDGAHTLIITNHLMAQEKVVSLGRKSARMNGNNHLSLSLA
jgi:hypothetical protein